MAEQLSMFESPKRKSGLLYLPSYLTIADQKDLLNDLRTVVKQSPLFIPTMSSGVPFKYKMTNIGDLGWISDRQGYRYESKHPVTGQPYPEIPSSLRSMIDDLSGKFGEKIRPDAVLLNWYSDGAKLGLHVDNTEKVSKPVVSLSLGDRGVFAIDTTGSRDRSTAMRNLERINVNSGDAIVFGGDLRNAYHAVERIDAGTAPPELGLKNSGRINLTARQVNETGTKYMASNKKIADGSISTTVSESAAKPPKLTSDIIADYLERMGGQATLVKPDGSQYNPNRKGRVNIGDRMTTAEKFGQAADVGLSNEFQKLPEVHARFDDRQVALQVQKELATGRLTTQKFFESPDKAIADQAADEIRRSDGLLGRGESVEVRKLGKAYEVVAVKQYQPVPSRGNSAVRSYGLDNDPEGRFVAFNKPEEAYAAPKSLKELQAEARRLEASGTQALAPDTRAEFKPQAQSNWEKLELPARSPMTEQLLQVAAEPKAIAAQTLDTPSDAWKLPQAKEPKLPHFYAQMASGDNPLGTGSTVQSEYDRAKSAYQGYQRFGYAPPDVEFPKLRELTKLAESEGVKGDDALKAYIKGKQNAPLIEAGVLPKPELPMTARLGQEYISPKSGKVGTIESVGKKGVKLNVDGQAVPVEYQTLEKLKYTGNKGYGFTAPAALRPVIGGFIGGTAGSALFKQLAKSAGLTEEQQNQAAATGGIIGSFGGSALTNVSANTKLRVPTAKEFAQTMVSTPQQRGAGARLFDLATDESAIFSKADRANILNNRLPQYDIKPVLSEAAVIAVDMATPSPYGVATVPALRTATELWQQNFDDVTEKGIAGLVNRRNVDQTIAKTKSLKDLTYQSLTAIAKGVGLPFPMTEQIVGDVVDRVPSGQQIMDLAKRFGFGTFDTRSGISSGGFEKPKSELDAMTRRSQATPRQSAGAIYEPPASTQPRSLTELRQQAADFNQRYESGQIPKQAYTGKFAPIEKLTVEQSAASMGMTLREYRDFQERAYRDFAPKEMPTGTSKKPPRIVKADRIVIDKQTGDRIDMDAYRKASKEWRQLTAAETAPLREAYDQAVKSGDKELQKAALEAIAETEARLPKAPMRSDFATAKPAAPKKSSGGFNRPAQPAQRQSTFIAESAVEAAAKSSGATTGQVKAQIATQRASGQAPDLDRAVEAIAPAQSKELAIRPVQSKELAVRSLKDMQSQSKALSTRVLSRQTADGMIVIPSQSMIDAGMKQQNRVDFGDRIGFSGIGLLLDTGFAAQVLTEASSRGENISTALSRAGISAGAGYATFAAASYIPNPYLRTAAQIGGGIAAVAGADKAIDQVVGRDAAREDKFAKDLSKLDLNPTKESDQWKPFANDSNVLAAYGNSLTAQIQSNLDYRPAARSLANLANSQSIDNARYASERGQSIDLNQQVGAGRRQMTGPTSTVYRDRGDGVTEAIGRRRAFSDTESRVLALQNLANESGYEVPRTGKFDPKLSEALEKLGYGDRQIGDYIQGRSKTIGSPAAKQSNQQQAKQQFALRSKLGKVTSSQMSEALSAERKARGLKGDQKLDQGTVDSVFSSLAGRSLSQMQGKPSFANKTFAKAGFGMK